MPPDQVTILKEVAKWLGKKTRPLNLFDPTVCKSPRDPERPWLTRPLPGDLFRDQISFEQKGRKLKVRANADFIVAQMSGNFDAAMACSVNRRKFSEKLEERIPGFPSLPVFASAANSNRSEFLNSAALQQALGNLKLQEEESLHIYTNAIELYLQRASLEEVMSAIAVAGTLADQLPPSVTQDLDLNDLPEKFKDLFGLIPKWAVSDDEERSELLEETSRDALQAFVTTVSPHIPAIGEYLHSFGAEPPPEAACALGTLAECCLDAEMQLRDTRAKN
jgi:hypothetical protein